MGAQGAAIIRSILSSAAETFAGVFGFLAPLMGPLAAGPAAAAQATVAGMAGSVASADIGMWQVPQRHALGRAPRRAHHAAGGSRRVPRSLLSDGGRVEAAQSGSAVHIHPTTNFHVSAIDAASVSQWMRQQQLRHDEGDGRGRPPRRRAWPAAAGRKSAHGLSSAASICCRRPASSPTTRSPSQARSA